MIVVTVCIPWDPRSQELQRCHSDYHRVKVPDVYGFVEDSYSKDDDLLLPYAFVSSFLRVDYALFCFGVLGPLLNFCQAPPRDRSVRQKGQTRFLQSSTLQLPFGFTLRHAQERRC